MKQKDFDNYTIYIPASETDKKVYREYGKKEAWEEDIWKHIIFEQPMKRKEVDEFRTEMDIHIQPSFAEAFGLITAESMLIGLPVVSVASGANLELIEDGVSGLLYRKGDATDMAEKVITMAEDDELRQEICKNAMASAEKLYTMFANCQAIYNIYESILNNRR
jgi:glycosyltransferase involved in cell wall biosynthesis